MWFRIVLFIALILPIGTHAQFRKRKSKISNSEGTLFMSWGYNRSWYSKSTLRLNGPGYQMEMSGFRAKDMPSVNLFAIPSTQFNARLGYYFTNGYAMSVGWDRLSYHMVNNQAVLLNGTIDSGTNSGLNGNYFNSSLPLDTSFFSYQIPSLDHINIKISRTGRSVRFGRQESFVISTDLGASLGMLLSSTDYRFGSDQDISTASLSGIALAAHAGVRFEFFKHIYLEPSLSGGYMNQFGTRLLENEPNLFGKQQFGFLQFETTLGVLLYVRPTNDCNSCPQW